MEGITQVITAIEKPIEELDALKVGEVLFCPNTQRATLETTKLRLCNRTAKKFSFTGTKHGYCIIKREK